MLDIMFELRECLLIAHFTSVMQEIHGGGIGGGVNIKIDRRTQGDV